VLKITKEKRGIVAESVQTIDRRLSVAPMLDYTDTHCRYFLRGFSARALLYTEMITTGAILRGERAHLLRHDPAEHPVALQLGGSRPRELALAARAGEEAGYDEINLNCGCPSDRVVGGEFGACLMRTPEKVAECVAAMRAAVAVPVTVKMRIGVVEGAPGSRHPALAGFDEADFEALAGFVRELQKAGCTAVIVHARKAVLGGLSPKENREVPPLRYDVVRRLTGLFPALPIVVNGGFKDGAEALEALTWCQGVMLGREAYHRPWVLAEIHHGLWGGDLPTREDLLARMAAYAQRRTQAGDRLAGITRHMLGLYTGEPGAREFRRLLSEGARSPGAGPDLLMQAARAVHAAREAPRHVAVRPPTQPGPSGPAVVRPQRADASPS
jgi:tRNA-dihydrouridine synthase A